MQDYIEDLLEAAELEYLVDEEDSASEIDDFAW